MARTKTNTSNDTKTLTTSCRNRHLDKLERKAASVLLKIYKQINKKTKQTMFVTYGYLGLFALG